MTMEAALIDGLLGVLLVGADAQVIGPGADLSFRMRWPALLVRLPVCGLLKVSWVWPVCWLIEPVQPQHLSPPR